MVKEIELEVAVPDAVIVPLVELVHKGLVVVTDKVGRGSTVTVMIESLGGQPGYVAVTVYEVVAEGMAVTMDPVEGLVLPVGVQAKDKFPFIGTGVAVKVAD
jgi:hypothetical protein